MSTPAAPPPEGGTSTGAAAPTGRTRWLELARDAARGGSAAEAAPPGQRMLVFRLDGGAYVLPIERVREIVRLRPITPVPRLPSEVLGVISLRGQVIQVIDPRPRLALCAAAPGPRSRIVVAHDGEGRVAGILVDAVEEVATVADEEPQRGHGGPGSAALALIRHRGRFVSIVDLDRVMDIDADS